MSPIRPMRPIAQEHPRSRERPHGAPTMDVPRFPTKKKRDLMEDSTYKRRKSRVRELQELPHLLPSTCGRRGSRIHGAPFFCLPQCAARRSASGMLIYHHITRFALGCYLVKTPVFSHPCAPTSRRASGHHRPKALNPPRVWQRLWSAEGGSASGGGVFALDSAGSGSRSRA